MNDYHDMGGDGYLCYAEFAECRERIRPAETRYSRVTTTLDSGGRSDIPLAHNDRRRR